MGATVAVVTTVVGAAAAQQQQRKAAGAEKKAAKIQRGQQAQEEAQQTRQQIRQERIRRAQILASAENTGVGGSSSASGSVGALQANTGSNIAFTRGQTKAADARSRQLQKSADFSRRANSISSITGAVSSGLSAFGGPTEPAPIEEGVPEPGLNQ